MRYAALLMVGVLVVPSGACEDGGTGPDGGEAVIEGRIESTTTLARSGPAATSAQTAQASTVEVVSVASGGSATVLAEATADASGDFRVEGVPAGRTDLIVVARNESGAEVGRVIAHGETEAQAVTVVAPINAETSVEGGAFVDLRADGRAEVAANSGGLAAFVRMSRAEAEAVASSESAVEGVAEGYAE
ncbi:MAG TPA: hypothetical protein VLL48_10380, partial [Longimicrobiales bacterium]|nr:hypothetical protein [Longimicrobiales bacterium]